MSTRTQRQSSLSSLSEAKQIVDGIPLGQVDPEQVVQVAKRVYEGQRAGGRADHGKQQQQTRSHVRAAGVGEGGWAGPGGREAEAQCALPGPPPTPAAAGRRGCGVNTQPNHKRAAPKGIRALPSPGAALYAPPRSAATAVAASCG